MKIHSCNCDFNYGLTDGKWEVERILAVFGNKTRKLFLVQWRGRLGEDSWEKEDSLLEDGCAESIKDFWDRSGQNPALDYYPDPEGEPGTRCWMCGWKSTANNKVLGLKTHIRRRKHRWSKKRANLTERKDIKFDKHEALQDKLPKVKWGEQDVDNCLQFVYLGAIFQTDGDQMPDIRSKCARAKQRAGTLRHLWSAKLAVDLKVRLYIAACCSILVYGSEGWCLTEEACRVINGANAYMLSHVTGKTKHEEAAAATTTFNIISWIRARRLKWVGHILRLDDKRLIKKTLRVIFDNRQEVDILMDVQETSWDALQKAATDRDMWRSRVRKLKVEAQRRTIPRNKRKRQTDTQRLNMKQRFTFLPPVTTKASSTKRTKQTATTISNDAARTKHYERLNAKAEEHEREIKFFEPRQPRLHHSTHTLPERQPPRNVLPSWDIAAAAVFSSSSSDSSSAYSSEHSFNSDADFWPAKHCSKALFERQQQQQPTHTPIRTPSKTNNNKTNNNNNNNDSDSLWAEPVPHCMLPTPSPTITANTSTATSATDPLYFNNPDSNYKTDSNYLNTLNVPMNETVNDTLNVDLNEKIEYHPE